jgi:hypothetical protein
MFNSKDSNDNEQSLNSLMSTSPTVLDDTEASTLRSLPTDANMTIINDDEEGSTSRSVDTIPAGNLTLFNSNDNGNDTVYRSLSISTQPTLSIAPPQMYRNESNFLNNKGPTMKPFEPVGTFSRMQTKIQEFEAKNLKLQAQLDNDDSYDFGFTETNAVVSPDASGPPVKPSFISYGIDHFEYEGDLEYFRNQFRQVATECGADLKYNATKFEYEILAYPLDQRIQYGVQLFTEPKTNRYVVEFRRLDGPGLVYRNHVMKVWDCMKKYNIGPGVPSHAKPPMPTFNMTSGLEVEAKTLIPMLKMVTSKLLDVSLAGLQMLIPTSKNPAAQNALKETKAATMVINVVSASENFEVDRCAFAVLREAVKNHHAEIISAKGLQIVLEKLSKSLGYDIALNYDILELQRNCIGVLKELCQCNDGAYLDVLRQHGAGIVVGKLIASSKCERLRTSAQFVGTLLKPF